MNEGEMHELLGHLEKWVPLVLAGLAGYLALVVGPIKGAVKDLKKILANYQEWRGGVTQSLEDNAEDHREIKGMVARVHERLDSHIEGSK